MFQTFESILRQGKDVLVREKAKRVTQFIIEIV